MANCPNPSQRLILAVGLARATFGTPTTVTATMASVSTPVAACTSGEEEDVYTTSCVPTSRSFGSIFGPMQLYATLDLRDPGHILASSEPIY